MHRSGVVDEGEVETFSHTIQFGSIMADLYSPPRSDRRALISDPYWVRTQAANALYFSKVSDFRRISLP